MCPGRLLVDAGQLLGSTVSELIPPEAQVHLLNAQRELLLALKLTLDHHRHHAEGAERAARRRPVRVEID
jgi:hypothetical protein